MHRRLAIAKEMYMLGIRHETKGSIADAIQAVINYDYAVETFIKAVLLEKYVPLTYEKSKVPKHFEALLKELGQFYKNANLVTEIGALHELRNNVQHSTTIPSPSETSRHRINANVFFNDVLSQVYPKITFDKISLGFLIDRKVGKIMLEAMEKEFIDKNYTDALYYAKHAVYYHSLLLRQEIEVPTNIHSAFALRSINRRVAGHPMDGNWELERSINEMFDLVRETLSQYIDNMEKVVDWIVRTLPIIDYNFEIQELFDYNAPYHPAKVPADESRAERARTLAYIIVTGMQSKIRRTRGTNDIYIFDLHPMIEENSVKVKVGIASSNPLDEARLHVKLEDNNQEIATIELEKDKPLQFADIIKLQSRKKYLIQLLIKSDKDEVGHSTSIYLP